MALSTCKLFSYTQMDKESHYNTYIHVVLEKYIFLCFMELICKSAQIGQYYGLKQKGF